MSLLKFIFRDPGCRSAFGFLILGIILCMVLFTAENYYQANNIKQCENKGGTYLPREHVCIEVKKIPLGE